MSDHPRSRRKASTAAARTAAARAGVAALSAVALLAGAVGPARADNPTPVYPSADQVAGAKAAAQGVADQVAGLDGQLASSRATVLTLQRGAADAGEIANGAQIALDDATRASAASRAKAADARARADQASLTLSRYAAEVYQGGAGSSQLDVFFGGGGPQDVLDRAAGVEAVGTEQARMVQDAASTTLLAQGLGRQAAEAETLRATAAAAATAAAQQARQDAKTAAAGTARLEAEQRQTVTQLAALQHTSVQLEQQRQGGLAAEEQRRREEANRRAAEAAAAAAAREAASRAAAQKAAADAAERAARTARDRAAAAEAAKAARALAAQAPPAPRSAGPASPARPGTPPVSPRPAPAPPPPPAPSGGVGAVLAFARAQLGKPYVWGASGPGAFDCSGLTLEAWARAGVSLSHFTGAQWGETARVPISELRPGDLVFYGTSGPASHHVGLYIGGGQMIHAPNPSTVVRIASIYSMSDLLPYGGRP